MKEMQTVKVVGVSESTSQTYANKIFTGGKIQATKAREVVLVNRFKKVFWEKLIQLLQDDSTDRVHAVLATGNIAGDKIQMQLIVTMNTPDFLTEDGTEAYLGRVE